MKAFRGTINSYEDDMDITTGNEKVSIKIALVFEANKSYKKKIMKYIEEELLKDVESNYKEFIL